MKIPLVRLAVFLVPLLACAQAPAPDLAVNAAAPVPTLNPALPTLFIAGDSTAAKNNGNPTQGWGVPFAGYFDPAKLNVVNRARGGRSSRTFISEGLWDQLLADVKARCSDVGRSSMTRWPSLSPWTRAIVVGRQS